MVVEKMTRVRFHGTGYFDRIKSCQKSIGIVARSGRRAFSVCTTPRQPSFLSRIKIQTGDDVMIDDETFSSLG